MPEMPFQWLILSFKKIGGFLLFTSIFLATVSVLALYQTYVELGLNWNSFSWFAPFTFFSTLSSYNFHWYLTPVSQMEVERTDWSQKNPYWNGSISIGAFLIAGWLFWPYRSNWLILAPAMLFTFLYSAPKIPLKPFFFLRKMTFGKTLYLSMVWTYVTAIIPFLLNTERHKPSPHYFIAHRFFLILALCILFDWRDREEDQKQGIKSMATLLKPTSVEFFLQISIYVSALLIFFIPAKEHLLFNTVPLIILILMRPLAKKSSSDYLYYGLFDGMMGVSGLLLICEKFV